MKYFLFLLLAATPVHAMEQFSAGVSFSSAVITSFGGNTSSGSLASGTTFTYYITPSSMTLLGLLTTINVAGIGGSGDTIKCNQSDGTGLSVTISAAAGAGTQTTTWGNIPMGYNNTISCHIESAATTRPILNLTAILKHN